MKGYFAAEAIGLGIQRETDTLAAFASAACTAVGIAPSDLLGGRLPNMKPWLAEITGRDPRYGLARTFLPPKVDYRESSSTANRGVWFCWTLEAGKYYEARYRTSWSGGFHRPFLRVADDGDVIEVAREKVERWLSDMS